MSLKNHFNRILNKYFPKNEFALFSAIVIGLIIFKTPIEDLFVQLFVNNWLSTIKSTWYNDFIFSLVALISILRYIVRQPKYVDSLSAIAYLSFISIIFTYYNSCRTDWEFQGFFLNYNLKYAYIWYLLLGLNLYAFIKGRTKNRKRNSTNENNSRVLIGDMDFDSEDLLGYTIYAKTLSDRLNSSTFNTAYAIGITGKWGSGKSFFINLLKRNLSKSDFIQLDFNPWRSTSRESIIEYFFNSLIGEISKYHSSIGKTIRQYADLLIIPAKNSFVNSIKTLLTNQDSSSLDSLFKEINKSLRNIDRKIIVFVDDLDRSDKLEILEVIRLIRNTANFRNIYFIVAYDKNYMDTALKNYHPYNNDRFLDKIFQLEIELPLYPKSVLLNILTNNLKSNFDPTFHEEINEAVHGSFMHVAHGIKENVETIRDVIRLTNSFTFNINSVIGSVDFGDFLKVELLRIKYPSIYELLRDKTGDYLELKNLHGDRHQYILKNRVPDQAGSRTPNKTILEEFMERQANNLFGGEGNIKRILILLEELFHPIYSNNSYTSISYPNRFSRYFAYNLYNNELSNLEFKNAIKEPLESLKGKIKEWVDDGKEKDLATQLHQLNSFTDREEFEKIISCIFYFANLEKRDGTKRQLISFDIQNLANKINNYEGSSISKLYQIDGIDSYRTFLDSLLNPRHIPARFEAEIIGHLNAQSDVYIPFSKVELQKFAINYFKSACSNAALSDLSEIWHMYQCTEIIEWTLEGNSYTKKVVKSDESKEILKNYFLKSNPKGLFETVIERKAFTEGLYKVSDTALFFWNSWKDFESAISTLNLSQDYVIEFLQFFALFAKTDFKEFVPFKFKHVSTRN